LKLQIKTPPWAEPLLDDAPYKAAYGGRGGGKSYFFAGLLVEEHLANPDQRTVCIRAVQNSITQSVKEVIEEMIYEYGVEDSFIINKTEILNKHGRGIIMFKGMQSYNASNIKSLQGCDRAWIEEAQDLSYVAWTYLDPTIRKEGSQIWASWNPENETDPIDVIFRKNPPTGTVIVNVNIHNNPWATEKNLQQMNDCMKRDMDEYRHIWLGEYKEMSEARVFKNWTVEEFETDKHAVLRFGADWGFATDPTCLIRGYVEGRNLYIDYEAYAIGCEIVDTPDLFMTVPEAEKWPIVADSARPETISHMKNHGFPKIMKAVKGAKSLEEGIEFLKSYDIIVHPRCKHVIDELTHYKYKVDPLTSAVTPVLEDKHNHLIDALRYALESIRRASKTKKKVQARPVRTRSGW